MNTWSKQGLWWIVLAAGLFGGCGSGEPRADSAGQRRLRVTCTIGMIADVIREIGGEHVQVTALMGPGVDPHLYKASAGDVARLVGADLVLYGGLHLEGKLTEVLEALARRKPTIAVTRDIDRARLLQPPQFGGLYDPHVWFDVQLWARAAETIRDALREADPRHADDYDRAAAAYLARLTELDAWCRSRAAELVPHQRVLVTSHDAYNYFGRAYGFEVIGIQGISTEEQATSRAIVELSRLIAARRIKAIFTESSVSPKAIRAVIENCRRAGWNVVEGGELFSDALGGPGTPEGTYIGMVRHNMNTIADALKWMKSAAGSGSAEIRGRPDAQGFSPIEW